MVSIGRNLCTPDHYVQSLWLTYLNILWHYYAFVLCNMACLCCVTYPYVANQLVFSQSFGYFTITNATDIGSLFTPIN